MPLFQVMSDLHLELFPGFRIPADARTAPNLVLAGDVGDPGEQEYAAFIRDAAARYERVFVVLGNHEAFGRSWHDTRALAREVLAAIDGCFGAEVLLLDKSGYDFPESDLRLVGTTLWSHVPGHDASDARCFIGDHRRIDGMSVRVGNALHAEDVAWLDSEIALAEVNQKRLLVVTHHAPVVRGTSHPKHAGGPLNSSFATDLPQLLRAPTVVAWVHGHTHFSADLCVNGVRVLSNQRGYADDPDEIGRFDAGRAIDVR